MRELIFSRYRSWLIIAAAIVGAFFVSSTFASGGEEVAHGAAAAHGPITTFLWIAVILILAKVSNLVEKFGQPGVLGELVMGVLLGNLVLLGINIFEPIKIDPIIAFLSELGVVVLLFQIGLESNIREMKKVGLSAFLVAVVGVLLPFILGTYIVGPWLLPGLSLNAYLFLGASLTATSVGITGRVFKDLGKLKTKEAQIVLGAAVFDDVFGLIILAVVSAMVTVGAVSFLGVSWIIGKAVLFLIGSIVIGQLLAPYLGKVFSKIQTGVGMKFTLAIAVALIFAYVAQLIGLAAIVGAFAAGLVLDPVHFKYFKKPVVVQDVESAVAEASEEIRKKMHMAMEPHSHKHIEDLIEPLSHFLVPIFFIVVGMSVKLDTLFNLPVVLVALAVTVAAFIGKYVAGYVAGKGVNKAIIGIGMVPRGEVGLIFAAIGQQLGVLSDTVFSVIVIMVILTTLIPPPILANLLKKQK